MCKALCRGEYLLPDPYGNPRLQAQIQAHARYELVSLSSALFLFVFLCFCLHVFCFGSVFGFSLFTRSLQEDTPLSPIFDEKVLTVLLFYFLLLFSSLLFSSSFYRN